MDESPAFLRHFINEPVYLIDQITADTTSSAEAKLAPETPTPAPEPKPSITYKGGNAQGIMIMVDHDGEEHIGMEDLAFLEKILSAVKLGLTDVAIVNTAHCQSDAQIKAMGAIKATVKISFGAQGNKLVGKPGTPLYQSSTHDGATTLLADPLKTIAANKQMKMKLWRNLQDMFL